MMLSRLTSSTANFHAITNCRKFLSAGFSAFVHICRYAHTSSRLHTAERRLFRPPKTYAIGGKAVKKDKPDKPVKVAKPPKSFRRRSVSKKPKPKPGPSSEILASTISTFNPLRLGPSDWINASHKYSVLPRLKHSSELENHPIWYGKVQRYPVHAKGFFYFSRPDPLPHCAAGRLRFRVMPEPNPALFPSGYDLLNLETGMTWEKHLLHMKLNRTDHHLYDAILNEGLITREEDRWITEMLGKVLTNRTRGVRAQVLDSILDTFVVNFSKTSFQLIVAEPDRIYEINNAHRWANDKHGPHPSPYSGIGLCRFVLLDTNKLGLLLVKYVVDPRPSDALKQEEGALVKRYSFIRKKEAPVVKSVKLLSEYSHRLLLENASSPQ